MFTERLFNMGNGPLIQQAMDFTVARHKLLAENIANLSTPGYVQKDLDAGKFEKQLRERLTQRRSAPPGSMDFEDISFSSTGDRSSLLFHDRNNRSAEQLMSDLSSNALRHNMYAEMLRKQYDSLQNVLKERVA